MILPEDPKERKELPMWRACLMFFPKTFVAITKLSMKGQKQHKYKEGNIEWDRSKSSDDWDSLIRHMFNLQEAIKNKDVGQIQQTSSVSIRNKVTKKEGLEQSPEPFQEVAYEEGPK